MAHRRGRRGGRQIESTRWSGGTSTFAAQTAGATALTFINASADPPETLLRLRGELVSWAQGPDAPDVATHCALGIALVPEGSSTTVTWSPITDDDAPWWFYQDWVLGYEEMVTDVIDVPGLAVFRKTIDLKGMRILRPDVEAQIVFEQSTLIAAMTVNTILTSRVLFGST